MRFENEDKVRHRRATWMDVKGNCNWGRGGGAKGKERGRDKSLLGGKRWRCGVVKSLLELWQDKLWAIIY